MNSVIYLFLIFLSFLLLDAMWLLVIAKQIYIHYLGNSLKASSVGLPIALSIYILLTLGLYHLILPKVSSFQGAFAWGLFLGALTYGIYNLTNYAVLKNWPLELALIDFAWGLFLCAITSLFAFFLKRYFE